MKVGIVGLPFSGKTSLFEAITGVHGAAVEHVATAHSATVPVPDERLDRLAKAIPRDKVTYAHVDFVDVAGVAADMSREQTVHILSALREVDGLVHVVRYFDSPNAPPHPRGSLDPKRDVSELMAELIVADLDIVERRIEKLDKQIAKFPPSLEHDKKELSLMMRLKEALEQGKSVAGVHLSSEESPMLRTFQLLSDKPVLNALNVGEDALGAEAAKAAAQVLGPDTAIVCARLEKEIAELAPNERAEFIREMGIGEPASQRIARACYRALGLRSFFTMGPPDARAWTVKSGDSALTAAGKIHSDIARGFIRAEVIGYDDFARCGSIKEAKNQGKMRLEGKDYVVQDGDIIQVRFKV